MFGEYNECMRGNVVYLYLEFYCCSLIVKLKYGFFLVEDEVRGIVLFDKLFMYYF